MLLSASHEILRHATRYPLRGMPQLLVGSISALTDRIGEGVAVGERGCCATSR